MSDIFDTVKVTGERYETQAFTLIRGDDLNCEAKTWDEEDEAYGTVYDDGAVYLWAIGEGGVIECESQDHLDQYL